MSKLTIYAEDDSTHPLNLISNSDSIAKLLNSVGITLEHWPTPIEFGAHDGEAEVLVDYRHEIQDLCEHYSFQTVDVAAVDIHHPQAEQLRAKFLIEHTHDDYEARFFVDGTGMFYIHVGARVYMLLCEQGDLIVLPANIPHWFDMGGNPSFKAVRFFCIAEGWVAHETGSNISQSFPSYEAQP